MRSVSAMVTGSLMLCLYIATFAAGAGFDSHVMKDSLRQLGHSFIKDKYLEAQKVEVENMNSPSLFSQQQYSDTGFMIISVAEEAACSFPVATFGFPINKCTVMDTYSYMVRLTQDSCAGGLIEYYADPACNTTTLLGTSSITESDLSCQAVDRPIFGGTFSSVACTTASEPRLIYDSAVTKEYLRDISCAEDKLEGYYALKLDHCFNTGDELSFLLRPTCEDDMVMWNFHALRTACALSPRSVQPYSNMCTVDEVGEETTDDDSGDDRLVLRPPPSISSTPFPTAPVTPFAPYNSSSLTYCATANAPTFAPTFVPTARPTTAFPTFSKSQLVRFDADQTVLGITLTAYKNREDFHANILKQAIADITTGASPEDITEWVVTETPVSAAREKTSFLRSLASWRVLEANSIDLAYRIEIQTTLSVNTVMSLLQNAVSSGAFTNRVRELALSNTAGALLDASSTSVSTVVVQKARNSPGPASTNEIIGIVVGVTAVSLILFGIITHKSCLPTF